MIVEKLFPIDSLEENGATGGTLGGSYLYEPDELELLDPLLIQALADAGVPDSLGIVRGRT